MTTWLCRWCQSQYLTNSRGAFVQCACGRFMIPLDSDIDLTDCGDYGLKVVAPSWG